MHGLDFREVHPAHFRYFQWSKLESPIAMTHPPHRQDMTGIRNSHRADPRGRFHTDAQFLRQFTNNGRFRVLARLDVPSRETPGPSLGNARRSSDHQVLLALTQDTDDPFAHQ